jgi:hypothetical protein
MQCRWPSPHPREVVIDREESRPGDGVEADQTGAGGDGGAGEGGGAAPAAVPQAQGGPPEADVDEVMGQVGPPHVDRIGRIG